MSFRPAALPLPLPPVPVTLAVAAAFALAVPPVAAHGLAEMGLLALALRHLLARLAVPQPGRAAALLFLLPSTLLDPGDDLLWAVVSVMALVAALDRRHRTMLAWFGLALGCSAEAMLIAPFFLALLINRRVPPAIWPVAPLVAAAILLTTGGQGWPIAAFASPYLTDTDRYPLLSFDAPNLWAIVQTLPLGLPLLGLAAAAAIGATAAYVARFSVQPRHGPTLIDAALLAALVTAGLVPRMDSHCLFLAAILAPAVALARRDRRSWTIALLVETGSTLALLGHRSGIAGLVLLGAIATIAATLRVAWPLLKPAANDNPLMARTV